MGPVDAIDWACVLCGLTFKMTEKLEQQNSASNFALSLSLPPWNYLDDSEGHSYGQLVIDSFITAMHPLVNHVSLRVFLWNIKSHRWLSPLQSRHLGTSHSSPNHHQLPCGIFMNLINSLKSLPFKGDFSLGKSQKLQGDKAGLKQGQSHLGDLMFHQKTLHKT